MHTLYVQIFRIFDKEKEKEKEERNDIKRRKTNKQSICDRLVMMKDKEIDDEVGVVGSHDAINDSNGRG